ncbi:MAG: aldose 1-epimerase [Spirochaetes bacterium]|nr:aldose 1-epimerase [Spirochaetota bacterium]MBU0953910.1 aldose 1-epimerase [Spirochaetota bacterium]
MQDQHMTISQKILAGYETLELENSAGNRMIIIPELGGTVQEIQLAGPDGRLHQLLRSDSENELTANLGFRGRFMFPFCGRVRDGSYSWHNQTLQLPRNSKGNALHGFIHRQAMQRLAADDTTLAGAIPGADKTSTTCSLYFEQAKEMEPGYPFDLALRLDFWLQDSAACIKMTAGNIGTASAPLSLGWHPYFRLDAPYADWRLQNSATDYILMGEDLFPCGAAATVADTDYDFRAKPLLGKRFLDAPLCGPGANHTILSAEAADYRISVESEPSLFGYTQLYTPPLRDSIAIEPVSAVSGAFSGEGPGLLILEPGQLVSGIINVRLLS